jgi:hypothetical protein
MKLVSVVLLCCLPIAGCSFVGVSTVPSGVRAVRCARDTTLPGLDALGAVPLGFLSFLTLAGGASNEYDQSTKDKLADIGIVALAGAITLGISAGYGFHHTGQCRSVQLGVVPAPPTTPSKPSPAVTAPQSHEDAPKAINLTAGLY